MPYPLDDKLVIGISSRALFNLEEENRVHEKEGLEAYRLLQRQREDIRLDPGPAFGLVASLLRFNEIEGRPPTVEVIIMSRNDPDMAIRLFDSVAAHGLAIERGAFTGGRALAPLLETFHVGLYLSRNAQEVQEAINAGIPAAVLYDRPDRYCHNPDEIHIAFDGDSVLFSHESEAIYQTQGLGAFQTHEQKMARVPMAEGPFTKLLRSLKELQGLPDPPVRLRVSLVTARCAPAHERAIRTLRAWNIGVDEAYFLGGVSKAEVLQAIGADIFFDDQKAHVDPASKVVPSGLVPIKAEPATAPHGAG